MRKGGREGQEYNEGREDARGGEKLGAKKGASYFSNVVAGWVGLFKSKRLNM